MEINRPVLWRSKDPFRGKHDWNHERRSPTSRHPARHSGSPFTHVRRAHKDSIADWILDTQPRSAPLSTSALLTYLAEHQGDVLERLMNNTRIADDLKATLAVGLVLDLA